MELYCFHDIEFIIKKICPNLTKEQCLFVSKSWGQHTEYVEVGGQNLQTTCIYIYTILKNWFIFHKKVCFNRNNIIKMYLCVLG